MSIQQEMEIGLTVPQKVLGGPAVIWAFTFLDVFVCNLLVGHALFLLKLKGWTLTATVSWWKWHGQGERRDAATFICFHYLDRFDKRKDGKGHCRP
jgi:hypothetical protein